MKNILVLAGFLAQFAAAYSVIGYLPAYRPLPSDSQVALLDEVVLSSLSLSGTGGAVTTDWTPANIGTVVTKLHAKGGKVLVSFWGTGADTMTMAHVATRATLIHNLVAFVALNQLDGIDLDWEPTILDMAQITEMKRINNVILTYFNPFLAQLRDSLTARWPTGKRLTAAVGDKNQVWYSTGYEPYLPAGFSAYLDLVHLMNYDDNVGAAHSTYAGTFGASGSVAHWTAQGVPVAKMVNGIPFYARCDWATAVEYFSVVAAYPNLDTATDAVAMVTANGTQTCGYNGVATTKAKVRESVRQGLAGAMFWELGQDVSPANPKSLLAAIHGVAPQTVPTLAWRTGRDLSSLQAEWLQHVARINGTHPEVGVIDPQGRTFTLKGQRAAWHVVN